MLAEVSGDGAGDLSFTLKYKERTFDSLTSSIIYASMSEPLKITASPKISETDDLSSASFSPKDFSLGQNYPNPFNPATTIEYSLPEPGRVTINIYNILMEKVRTLADEEKGAGKYKVEFNAGDLPSGSYIYTLIFNNYKKAGKMALIK